jgi:hypothetical protein
MKHARHKAMVQDTGFLMFSILILIAVILMGAFKVI